MLFGGGLLAIWMALEVMRVGHDTMRRWHLFQPASHVDRESAEIEVADALAPPRDIRNIGRVPGVGSPHMTPPSMSVRIAAFRNSVVAADVMFDAILESLKTERPDAHVTETEIELLRQLSREMLQGKFDYRPSIRSPQGAVILAQLLFELGYVDAQWMQEATRTTNESLRVVIAPQVNPGTVLGVRVVDRFGTRASLCRIVSITRRTEDVGLSLPSNYGRYRPPFGLFLASDELGSDEVVVEWEGPAFAWTVDDSADSGSIRISDQRRRETLRYDVVAGLEVLPDLSVSPREQVSAPISNLSLLVAECGERDAVHLLLTNNASTQIRGRWTVMIDDAWCDLGYATTVLSRRRFGVLLAAPRGGWPDQLTVRFDPVEGASDRLPTPPDAILGDPNARLLWANARAVDSTWKAALEFTLLRMDRTNGEAIEYRWQSE
ncbi:MAG: hypothetical protein JNM94_13050 [Phycisphaerae bacterium]|nr:hypothetical protein [Phycisphaerae bacterium]